MRGVRCGPVTTTAISKRRSFSGSRPVISQSIQTKLSSDLVNVGSVGGVPAGEDAFSVIS